MGYLTQHHFDGNVVSAALNVVADTAAANEAEAEEERRRLAMESASTSVPDATSVPEASEPSCQNRGAQAEIKAAPTTPPASAMAEILASARNQQALLFQAAQIQAMTQQRMAYMQALSMNAAAAAGRTSWGYNPYLNPYQNPYGPCSGLWDCSGGTGGVAAQAAFNGGVSRKSPSQPESPTVDPTGVFNGGVSRKSVSQPTSLQPEDPIVGSTTDNLAQSLKGESQDIDIVIRQAGSQRGAEEATSAVPTMSQLESNGSKDDMGCAQS